MVRAAVIDRRRDAVRQIVPEAADVADRKDLGRDLHRRRTGIEVTDPRRGDDGSRAERTKRVGSVHASPQQRQRSRDHAGAQDPENCQYALDRVGKLNADDGVGLQAELTQLGRDRGNGAVGFRISETARRAIGEALAVGWIGERDSVGPSRGGAAERVVEGRCRNDFGLGIAEDHLAGSCHQDSGK